MNGRAGVRVVAVVVGLAGFTASLTVLFLSMRAVLDIGGYCASGGPYQIATTCPQGVDWATPLSIFVGIAFLGVYWYGSAALPGPHLVLLAWPALFLSLGYNFWEYGLNPPGDASIAWGWIVCGVLFVGMGGLPLLALANRSAARAVFWADAPGSGRPTGRPRVVPGLRPRPRPAADPGDRQPRPDSPADDVATALERVSALHASGALSDEEFRVAKERILGRKP
jgi:hypothetical protein